MSIRDQLLALQAENASLSEAADEAANLAESLASDNAKLRTKLSSLSESSARKDRQISRLTSQIQDSEETITTLHHRINDLSTQVDELKQLSSVTDEIELVLRRTVQTLQQRITSMQNAASSLSQQPRSSNLCVPSSTHVISPHVTLVAAFRTHADILALFSQSPVNAAVFLALANASAIIALALSALADHSSRASCADPLSNPLASATVLANTAAKFLLSDSSHAVERARLIDEALILLRNRISDIAQSRASTPVSAMSPPNGVRDVTRELLEIAVSALSAILPATTDMIGTGSNSPFEPQGGLTKEAHASLRQIACENSSISNMKNKAETTTDIDLQVSRLKQVLKRRERELDDLRVRHAAFEQSAQLAHAKAASASADAEALRAQLAAESTIDPNMTSPSQSPSNPALLPDSADTIDAITPASCGTSFITPSRQLQTFQSPSLSMSARRARTTGGTPRLMGRGATPSSGAIPRASDMTRIAQEQLSKLRTTYTISGIECLLNSAPGNVDMGYDCDTRRSNCSLLKDDKTDRIYQALRMAHTSARKAAACARVVQLRKDTLAPVSRGATLSIRRSLEALAASNKIKQPFPNTAIGDPQPRKKKTVCVDAFILPGKVDEFSRLVGLNAP